eukprot:gene23623-28616_t
MGADSVQSVAEIDSDDGYLLELAMCRVGAAVSALPDPWLCGGPSERSVFTRGADRRSMLFEAWACVVVRNGKLSLLPLAEVEWAHGARGAAIEGLVERVEEREEGLLMVAAMATWRLEAHHQRAVRQQWAELARVLLRGKHQQVAALRSNLLHKGRLKASGAVDGRGRLKASGNRSSQGEMVALARRAKGWLSEGLKADSKGKIAKRDTRTKGAVLAVRSMRGTKPSGNAIAAAPDTASTAAAPPQLPAVGPGAGLPPAAQIPPQARRQESPQTQSPDSAALQ